MTVTRAIVVKMVGNKCEVTIPSMSTGTQIEASICAQKGQIVSYFPGETVFVAWLDSKEWVILGTLYTPNLSTVSNALYTNTLSAQEGQLGKNILLDDSGLRVSDLIRIGRNFDKNFYKEV